MMVLNPCWSYVVRVSRASFDEDASVDEEDSVEVEDFDDAEDGTGVPTCTTDEYVAMKVVELASVAWSSIAHQPLKIFVPER